MFSVTDIENERVCFLVKLVNFNGVVLLENDARFCCRQSRFTGTSSTKAIFVCRSVIQLRRAGDDEGGDERQLVATRRV